MKLNEIIEKDIAPIEYTQEWIDLVNNVKRKYNVDGMHIINYEMDYPTVIIYKWGFNPYEIWRILKSHKIGLSKKRLLLNTVHFLTRKIQEEDRWIKWHFEKEAKMYETKTIKKIIFEEVIKFYSNKMPILIQSKLMFLK